MAPPRVLIDGFNLDLGQPTGIGTYARNVSFACRDLGCPTSVLYGRRVLRAREPALQEVVFFDDPPPAAAAWRRGWETTTAFAGVDAVAVPVTGRVIVDGLEPRLPHFDALYNVNDLYSRARRHFSLGARFLGAAAPRMSVKIAARPDIAHWTCPMPVKVRGAINVYTVHDLVPLRLPSTTLDDKVFYFRLLRKLLDRADHIVTVSDTTRRDVLEFFGVRPERVTTTYQSVDIAASDAEKPLALVRDELAGLHGLDMKGYMLYFGAIEPKKNLRRLIEAHRASNIATPLVIVGKLGWKYDKELELMRTPPRPMRAREGGDDPPTVRLIEIGYASRSALVSLIRGAKAVLFPSLYEGFGLPVLEAMALGTPVMTSRLGATAEIAGDGALLVDPYDTADIAVAIARLDDGVELRRRLAERGRAVAGRFSPERHRDRLGAVYDRLLSEKRRP